MNKSALRSNSGKLLTLQQVAESANLGLATTRRIAEESQSIRRIGRCVRINPELFFSYVEKNYS